MTFDHIMAGIFRLAGAAMAAVAFTSGVKAVVMGGPDWWSMLCFFIGIGMLGFLGVFEPGNGTMEGDDDE